MDIRYLKQLMVKPIIFNDCTFYITEVHYYINAPHWVSEPHKHPWYEYTYITSGAASTFMCDCEYITSAGNASLIPPGIIHSNFGGNDTALSIRFYIEKNSNSEDSSCFSNLSSTLMQPYPHPISTDISSLFKAKSLFAVQASFINFILELHERFTSTTNIKSSTPYKLSKQVIFYLNEYYKDKIYVDDIAKALGVSYRTLSRVFKAETGMSIIEKLTAIRITNAKQLLLSTNYTLSQIATMVGFENEYYFSNIFSKYVFCSPNQFRKRSSN